MTINNPILNVDSYKASHYRQYPPNTTGLYSYIEARKGQRTLFFGLQAILESSLRPVTKADVDEARDIFEAHGVGFNYDGWMDIVNRLGGCIPMRIRAVSEGTVVGSHNVLVTVESTDPACFWIPSYFETMLLRVWYPTTVATISYEIREKIRKAIARTSDDPTQEPFKLHDFGARGVSSAESAMLGGMAHLVCFQGTDTVAALVGAKRHYQADMAGFSIPAAEHSTITSWSRAHEFDAYSNMVDQYAKPGAVFAVVSDSYDIYNAIDTHWAALLPRVRERGATLVVRPDCYDADTEILTQQGWVRFSDLTETSVVAQYCENGSLEYVKPSRIIAQEYCGPMYHVYNKKRHVDLMVTPNHRMVSRHTVTKKVTTALVSTVSYYHANQHIHSGVTAGTRRITPLERLYVAFQADGSYSSYAVHGAVRFNFAKQRKTDRLVRLCDEAGVRYKVSIEPSRPDNTQVYVWFNDTPPKTFQWVIDSIETLSGVWAQEFIEEMSYWDACRRHTKRFKYDTTIPVNAEAIQLVATLAGYRTCYSTTSDMRKLQFSDVHTVHVNLRDHTGGQAITKTVTEYSGMVYCVTVPSGMVVVRRNRCVSVSGNSGDPQTVVTASLNKLAAIAGFDVNSKGFKVLKDVRIMQGDGMNSESIADLIDKMTVAGYAIDNVAFGMGGGLLQQCNRDTFGFAMKCSAALVDGEYRDVFKDPITDTGKRSKRGLVTLSRDDNGEFVTRQIDDDFVWHNGDELETIWEDGKFVSKWTFSEIRHRANDT